MGKVKWLNKNLALLLAGRTVSDVGSSIQLVVMPLYILDVGGDAKTVGLFSFLYLLPILLMYPIGGVIGDRINRKKIMVAADFLSGLAIVIMAYLSHLDKLNIGIILVFQIIVSLFFGFFDPASKGVLPQIVKRQDLKKANSSIAALRIIAAIIAPVLGVWLYITYGITFLFMVNGLSFLISAFSEMFISYTHKDREKSKQSDSVFNDLKQGFVFIKGHKIILNLCLYFMMVFMLIQPIFSVVLPYFFRTSLNYPDTYYGVLQGSLFVGALIGTVSVGFLLKDKESRKPLFYGIVLLLFALLIFAILLFPAVIQGLGNDSFIYFGLLILTLVSMYGAMLSINIPFQTIIQKLTPENYMSRVFSIVSLIAKSGGPLGALVYGLVIERASIHWSVMVATFIIGIISLLFTRALKNTAIEEKGEIYD